MELLMNGNKRSWSALFSCYGSYKKNIFILKAETMKKYMIEQRNEVAKKEWY